MHYIQKTTKRSENKSKSLLFLAESDLIEWKIKIMDSSWNSLLYS